MTQNVSLTKNDIVNYGIKNGYSYDEIGNVLNAYGHGRNYNPLAYSENWKELPTNAINNSKDFVRNLRTFGGVMVKPILEAEMAYKKAGKGDKLKAVKESFKKSLNDNGYRRVYGYGAAGAAIGSAVPIVGTVGGALLGSALGMAGSPKALANAFLAPYDTKLEDFNIKKWNVNPGRIIQGAMKHPVDAVIDTAPITLRGGSLVARNIPNNAPKFLKQLFPSQEQREFNRAITQSMANSRTGLNDLYRGSLMLETMPFASRKNILEYIITGKGKPNSGELKLAKEIRDNLYKTKTNAIERGLLDGDIDKINTITQKIMYELPESNLYHHDIASILRGDELRDIAKQELLAKPKLLDKIKKLAKEAEDQYNKGDIVFVSQKLSHASDPSGNLVARNLVNPSKNYFDIDRIIGKQALDKWSNRFDDTIKFQLDQLNRGVEFEDTISDLIHRFNMDPITREQIKTGIIPNDKIAFSKNAFRDFIKGKLNRGEDYDISDAINKSNVLDDSSVLVNKTYMNMLDNAFKKSPNTATRRMLNSFKKVVLAQPHWFVLNRIGNLTNHFMNGGTLKDLYEAYFVPSVRKYIPEQLKHQTSFGSYLKETEDGVQSMGFLSSSKKGVNKALRAWDRFKGSDKGLKEIYDTVGDISTGLLSDVTANPFFKLEATGEYLDRSANFIRQCKRYAKKNKLNWKDVLKKSNEDPSLFAKLNDGVNKALGDYIGRNYALPFGFYDILSESVPFYRFLTQTARTSANQLMHYPFAFASNVTIPSRVGSPISEYILKNYNLNKDMYNGGVIYDDDNGQYMVAGFEPLPAGTLLESGGNTLSGKDLMSILSPTLTTIPNLISYRKFNRVPSSPGLHDDMHDPRKMLRSKEEREPLTSERYAYALDELLNITNHMYRSGHTWVPELYNTITGGSMQSGYDTNSYHINPESFKRILPSELSGKWLGIQTRSVGTNKKKTKNQMKQSARQAVLRNRREQARSGREIK